MVAALLAAAATTKRAQIPFSAWLPAAMAAPTPVSSLVHSSTLVTAGIYLLIRFRGLLYLGGIRLYILLAGIFTIVIAGLSALFETDIKKVVALSTLSQLGLIISALGCGITQIAFFHLINHAFFKALLFIAVGNIIHLSGDYQDLRRLGLFQRPISVTLAFRFVANFRLMGLPYMSGFYSKDIIMEFSMARGASRVVPILFYFGTLCTAAYTLRFLFFTCWGATKGGVVS